MSKPLDLVGKKFGYLTVKQRYENNEKGNTQWLCICDCGNEKVALGYDLTHGRTTTCGCKNNISQKPSKKRIDLTGKVFGNLKVISIDTKKHKNNALYWNCECFCGNKIIVSGSNLKTGHTTSCGCVKNIPYNFIDLTGKRFGRLVVLEKAGRNDRGVTWKCKCDCGNIKEVCGLDLRDSSVLSCGCLKKEFSKKPKRFTHKASKTRLYREWSAMKMRCKENYHNSNCYFDKGISVCKEWSDSFEKFKEWSYQNGYSDDLSIDRIDNCKGYNPENCRWITMKEQQNNKTTNVYIEYNGEVKTLKQWSEKLSLSYPMLKARWQKGELPPKLFRGKTK